MLQLRILIFGLILFASRAVAQQAPELEFVLQKPHSMPVLATAATSDGSHVISAASSGEVIVWGAQNGKILRSFFAGNLHGPCAIDADRGVLATGIVEVDLWDWRTGTKLRTLPLPKWQQLASIAISGDGKYLATGTSENVAILWEIESGKRLGDFKLDKKQQGSAIVALNHDGGRLLCVYAGADHAVLWDTGTGAELQTLPVRKSDRVRKVVLSADGQIAMTLTQSGSAIVWNVSTAIRLGAYRGYQDSMATSASLTPDGKQIIVAGGYGRFTLSRLSDGTIVNSFKIDDTRRVSSTLGVSSDGRFLVSGNVLGSIEAWDVSTGQQLAQFRKDANRAEFTMSGDEQRLFMKNSNVFSGKKEDEAVSYWTFWNLSAGTVGGFRSQYWPPKRLFSRDGTRMLAAEGQVSFLQNTDNGQRMHDFKTVFNPNNPNNFDDMAYVAAISGDASRVLIGGSGKLSLWDAASGKKIRTIASKGPMINGLAMSQDGSHFAASSFEFGSKHSIHWWDTNTGKKVHAFKAPPSLAGSMALSADDKYLAAGLNNGKVFVWETKMGNQIQAFGKRAFGGADRVSVSDDGQFVASSWDLSRMDRPGRPTKLWKVGSEQPVQSFPGYLLALSGNAKHVWTESKDGAAILFDAKTGNELCRVHSLDYGKQWLVVTPEGLFDGSENARQFVAYRESGTLKLLDDDETINRHHQPGLLQRLAGPQQ